jgi:hypothetical protein
MEQHKINYPNISITLLLLIAGIGAGTLSKIPNITIPYPTIIIPDWLPLIVVGVAVTIVAVTIYMLTGVCGMTGRMR